MTPDELDEIEARADAATYGPWRSATFDVEEGYALRAGIYRGTIPLLLTTSGVAVADAAFIAHAREDVPALLAALREAWVEVEGWRRMAESEKTYAKWQAQRAARVEELCAAVEFAQRTTESAEVYTRYVRAALDGDA